MKNKDDKDFPPEEATKRFKAALLGARLAGHVPMKAKKASPQKSKRTKASKKPTA